MLLVQPSRSNLKRTLLKALPTLLRTCAKPSPSHARRRERGTQVFVAVGVGEGAAGVGEGGGRQRHCCSTSQLLIVREQLASDWGDGRQCVTMFDRARRRLHITPYVVP